MCAARRVCVVFLCLVFVMVWVRKCVRDGVVVCVQLCVCIGVCGCLPVHRTEGIPLEKGKQGRGYV